VGARKDGSSQRFYCLSGRLRRSLSANISDALEGRDVAYEARNHRRQHADEPKHPSLQQYERDHTKRWSASVAAADAIVIVTPEYNYGPPPSLINAFDYVYKEWNYKPAGFVSYGGVSGGLRAVQMEKQTLTTLKVVPIVEAVVIPMVAQSIADGRFRGNELQTQAAKVMLDELLRRAGALKPLCG
jgi:NAD(P)H-dependent FMN reductase